MTASAKYYLFIIAFCFSQLAFAQRSRIDSLLTVLKTSKEDTNKVNALNDLSAALYFSNPDSTILLAADAAHLAQQKNYKKGEGAAYHNSGIGYYIKGDYPNSLEFYLKALKIREATGEKKEMARDLGNIGIIYTDQGDYARALDYGLKALKIGEETGNKKLQGNTLGNIGNIYFGQNDFDKALRYYLQSVKISEELGFKQSEASTLSNIATIYDNKKEYPTALRYYLKALKMDEELGNENEMAINLNNIGIFYFDQQDYPKALEYYFKALPIDEKTGNKSYKAAVLANIGSVYIATNKEKEAEKYLSEALALDKEIGSMDDERQVQESLSRLYEKTGRDKLALQAFKNAALLKDSLFSTEKDKAITRKEMNFEFEKKEANAKAEQDKKDAVAEGEKQKQKVITYSVSAGLFLVLLLALFILRGYRQKQKANIIITQQKNEVEKQKHIIEEKNKDITDSINYAKRIQQAKLPNKEEIYASLPSSFILFKPKDIVSGDFYFFHKSGDSVFIAAADCTGHGVPGALMSMICSEKLEDAVSLSADPSEILKHLNKGIKNSLRQSDRNESTRDGMDIALCRINTANRTVAYAGANRPVWLIRNGKKEIEETKATKKAIGGYTEDDQHFETHQLQLQQGDTLYIFSDGFSDLFGGKTGKKLTTKKFKQLLFEIQDMSMQEQEKQLEDFSEDWKAGTEQVDDILVIGVRL